MASPKLSLKLVVHKKEARVLFAEVPKEFVDFLFHIFSLPLGTLIELLGSNQMVGLLSNDASCEEDQSGAFKTVYRCPNGPTASVKSCSACLSYATLHVNSQCPYCSRFMNVAMSVVKPKEVIETKEMEKKMNRWNVKEVVSYIVMDDLVVNPMSTNSSITLLNKFGVKDLTQVEEKTVCFGKDEVSKLLEASLKTDKVLTNVFVH